MPNYFYTDASGNKCGPVTLEALKALAAQRIIASNTCVEDENGKTATVVLPPATAANPFINKTPSGHNPFATPVPATVNPFTISIPAAKNFFTTCQRKKRINFWTRICIICVICLPMNGLVQSVFPLAFPDTFHRHAIGTIELESLSSMETMAVVIFYIIGFLTIFCGITGLFSYYFYIRRLWEEVPGEFARTTPGKAALLMFVPFINWLWQFVAFVGLYKDMNKATESYGLGSYFEKSWIEVVCCGWILVNIIGLIYLGFIWGELTNLSPDAFIGDSMTLDTVSILFLMVSAASTISAIITIFVYWIIRKDVLEFIDIKESLLLPIERNGLSCCLVVLISSIALLVIGGALCNYIGYHLDRYKKLAKPAEYNVTETTSQNPLEQPVL